MSIGFTNGIALVIASTQLRDFLGLTVDVPGEFIPRLGAITSSLSPALTVAMPGAIESLLSAVVADRMGGDRHNPNTELFAQGVANIVSPMFSGLPATGALARTATNIRGRAVTDVRHHSRADAHGDAAVWR